MAIHNITDSALLVKKSRRTIQRYIASGKLTIIRDTLGNPQIDTTELIAVFGPLSKVSQNKLVKKSQYVAVKSSSKTSKKNNTVTLTHDELEDIITRAVEKALSKAIPLLIEQKNTAQILEPISSTAPVVHKKRKTTLPIHRPSIAKKKEAKNGYAVAFGLPNAITEVIHLRIMKLHGEGLTSREIGIEVSVSQASIQRTINVST
ncbi:hypothetical protein CXF85_12935 [Colwellia sp. 75C3]|uniref:hypothetical protein n=1 Tax=Colwellia sp. 75C3 TaxID=888425 RepID=UPI000C3458C4|nr:hypothetical protein [Colwellia sp. 75C3]PKG82390.1 hypothetical protein CXF85_12935 [Colwellia sp. 75C3]